MDVGQRNKTTLKIMKSAKQQAIEDMKNELPKHETYNDGGAVEIWNFNPNKLKTNINLIF